MYLSPGYEQENSAYLSCLEPTRFFLPPIRPSQEPTLCPTWSIRPSSGIRIHSPTTCAQKINLLSLLAHTRRLQVFIPTLPALKTPQYPKRDWVIYLECLPPTTYPRHHQLRFTPPVVQKFRRSTHHRRTPRHHRELIFRLPIHRTICQPTTLPFSR